MACQQRQIGTFSPAPRFSPSAALTSSFPSSPTPSIAGAGQRPAGKRPLKKVNASFESSLQSLETQLSEYEDRTRKLAIVAGLDTLADGADAGVGGLTNPAAGGPTGLSSLATRAQARRRARSGRGQLEERGRWIRRRPVALVMGLLTSWSAPPRPDQRRENHWRSTCARGKAVVASADGIVTRPPTSATASAWRCRCYGFGMTTRYGHMSRVNVKQGQKVKRATSSASSARPAAPPAITCTTKCCATATSSTRWPSSSTARRLGP
jgi:murein DD-endopeptidase MepM/ murein hydrolase activator NlpD